MDARDLCRRCSREHAGRRRQCSRRRGSRSPVAREVPKGSRAVEDEPSWIDEAPGSNAFALSGSRTTTGKPILLGNPHLQWSSLYWEAHVRVPGTIDFYGSTLVGIPVLRAGFNDRLGFVTTNNAPDLDDVVTLTVDPSQADHYLFDGGSRPLRRRDATVQVRQDDGSMRERDANVLVHAYRSGDPPLGRQGLHRPVDAARCLPVFRRLLRSQQGSQSRPVEHLDAAQPGADVELHLCRCGRQHPLLLECADPGPGRRPRLPAGHRGKIRAPTSGRGCTRSTISRG